MRSAVIFAALAVGTCARVIEKEVYVTEWTTTTITETVTQWPTNTPSAAVLVKQDHTKPTNAALPTLDISKKDPAEVEAASAAAPTTAAAVVEPEPSSATTSSTTSSSTTEAELKPVTTAAPAATSVATSSATSTTAAATGAPNAANSYQKSILHYHNLHRSDHSASGLTWSGDLAGAAHTLASRCEYGHDTSIPSASGDYGQNIAYGYDEDLVGEKIISEMMYTDEAPYFASLYGEANPDQTNFEKWGHFTQIVWKATTQVGCATVSCSDLKNVGGAAPYTVCNYGSPGNYAGEYAENVLKPSA
ncbi:hypothetical protein VN97_g1067 [Penicillium thymicola]|uniref:SCP domain-containing protein n=1 Tax=Penicillium thymicola TaxID=293382 RepID=A0AAI9XCL6_PENTH|nr:hypothetical protein VN97_g1067 [Penicillium thymicola]